MRKTSAPAEPSDLTRTKSNLAGPQPLFALAVSTRVTRLCAETAKRGRTSACEVAAGTKVTLATIARIIVDGQDRIVISAGPLSLVKLMPAGSPEVQVQSVQRLTNRRFNIAANNFGRGPG